METHATVWAIQSLFRHNQLTPDAMLAWPSATQACDWARSLHAADSAFAEESAAALVNGETLEDPLPTCPICALFVDLALRESGLTCGENVEAT